MKTCFVKPDSKEWSDVLHKVNYDFYHLPSYVALTARQEEGDAVAFIAQEDECYFVLPFIIRSINSKISYEKGQLYDAVSPYGYPGPLLSVIDGEDYSLFVQQAVEFLARELKQKNIISAFIRLHPLFSVPHKALAKIGHLVQHGETVSIDLTLSNEEIWQQMRYGHRSEIKKLEIQGYKVCIDECWKYFDDFIEIYYQSMQRVEASEYYYFPREYFLELRQILNGNLHLCVVLIDDQVACAGLFTEVNGIVQYHLSGTKNDFLKKYPSKLMLDYMWRWAKERGNQYLHLGGGVGGTADSLFKFKAGFSKNRHPFYTWRVITDKNAYLALVNKWEAENYITADGIEGFFPAYRKIAIK